MEVYLKPTPVIDCNAPVVREKAQNLTRDKENDVEKAKALFYFVRDEIKYNPYVLHNLAEHNKASVTLSRGEGYCVQKAILLAALARAIRIPARPGFADIRNYITPQKLLELMHGNNLFIYHGYCELYIGQKWVKATPAFDLEMCQKHHIIPVEFDGKNNATFHRNNQEGKLHIEYVHDYGHYPDLPLEEMLEARVKVYGPDYLTIQESLVNLGLGNA
jgi:transglutaminase-like putative cysteine protease